jgi:predicted Zn-dependent protease
MTTSKRLEMLLKMTSDPGTDSFTWYALAMEQRGLGRIDEALATFARLRSQDPGYVPGYQMCGAMLAEAGRRQEAKEWLAAGIEVARKRGNAKAEDEMQQVLDGL